MANEIYMTFDEGNTLYALIWRKTDDAVFNNTTNAFVTYTDAAIADLVVNLTNVESESDYYSVDFPVEITASGSYRVQIMLQPGGSPDADADFGIAQGEIQWGGTSEVTLLTVLVGENKVINIYGPGE